MFEWYFLQSVRSPVIYTFSASPPSIVKLHIPIFGGASPFQSLPTGSSLCQVMTGSGHASHASFAQKWYKGGSMGVMVSGLLLWLEGRHTTCWPMTGVVSHSSYYDLPLFYLSKNLHPITYGYLILPSYTSHLRHAQLQ